MRKFLGVILLASLVAPLSVAWGQAEAPVVNAGFNMAADGQSAENRVEAIPLVGDSYLVYTFNNSTCNADGTMQINIGAEYAQADGTIQTVERNPAETSFGSAEERIVRGPAGPNSGDGLWNGTWTWTLEDDDTGFETVRGRDGASLMDPLIYESTVRYDCSGILEGQPPMLSYEYWHRDDSEASVPTLSTWAMVLMGLLLAGLTASVIRRKHV